MYEADAKKLRFEVQGMIILASLLFKLMAKIILIFEKRCMSTIKCPIAAILAFCQFFTFRVFESLRFFDAHFNDTSILDTRIVFICRRYSNGSAHDNSFTYI